MRIVDNALRAHAVQLLQIVRDLRKHLPSARTRELADVRRDHGAIAPGKRHGGFRVGTDRERRHRRAPGKLELERRRTASQSQRSHAIPDHTHHRIVRRSNDRTVMVQEAIGHVSEARLGIQRLREDRLAAHIPGSRDQRGAKIREQQVVQRTVGQHDSEIARCRGDRPGERTLRRARREQDRPHAAA